VAFGARTPVTDYLTTYEEPDAVFVLVARNGAGTGTLFIVPVEPRAGGGAVVKRTGRGPPRLGGGPPVWSELDRSDGHRQSGTAG
jgi:hypothetical protein